jgi:hypothetical protein
MWISEKIPGGRKINEERTGYGNGNWNPKRVPSLYFTFSFLSHPFSHPSATQSIRTLSLLLRNFVLLSPSESSDSGGNYIRISSSSSSSTTRMKCLDLDSFLGEETHI